MNFARVLSDVQIEQIQQATEEVLEVTGFQVMEERAQRQCAAAGAKVDAASGRVRLPRQLLRELLKQVPASYTIRGIDGRSWEIGGDVPLGVAIVTDPWIIDYASGRPRRPVLSDLRRHTVIAQKMEHVASVSCMDFPAADFPGPGSNLRALQEHLLYFSKHSHFAPAHPDSVSGWLDIMNILSGGRPLRGSRLFSVFLALISPLTISEMNVGLLRLACEYDAPVIPTVCPMAGSTSPHSLAGTLVQGNAENLFTAALAQIIRPGQPYLYAFGPSTMDMRSGHDLYYTLEKVLWKIASVQMAKSYKLPSAAECGGTMTYRYDPQNGMESSLFMLAAVDSGADVLAGFGSGYTAMAMSAEMMVIQESWMQAARFLRRGINTEPFQLGVASIAAAGPGGDFLTDELTLQTMRDGSFFTNDLFDYNPCGHEGPGMLERAHAKVEQMVAGAESPHPQEVREGMCRYFHDRIAGLSG